MDKLRTPLFVIALVLAAIAVASEVGSCAVVKESKADLASIVRDSDVPEEDKPSVAELRQLRQRKPPPPGLGIPALWVLDVLVLFIMGLIGAALLVPDRIHGRLQGCGTLIVSFLLLLAGIRIIFLAFGKLMIMLSLLLAVPFGTIAYMAIYGFFNKGGAAAVLGFLMLAKIVLVVLLILAHQRFLQNKGLVLILLFSLLATWLTGFLHAFVPRVLASITDAVAAIVNGCIGLVWALLFLIGALVSVYKVLRVDRAT